MSEQSTARPKVPEGQARFLKTRQKETNDKGFVGYETIWETVQKVSDYVTPKRP